MAGRVETNLKLQLVKKSALLFVLIDSEVSNVNSAVKLAKEVEKL
ncbi:MAG: geranylgeranylglyceryl/heptaprenylglyceryl phosphate synthase, partial [Nitrosopumilales archaeon]|nr:geranylgeranylglyceryl/heptaprenylglyceryl phosphate synthase [Nitrosopumilales archaeon]